MIPAGAQRVWVIDVALLALTRGVGERIQLCGDFGGYAAAGGGEPLSEEGDAGSGEATGTALDTPAELCSNLLVSVNRGVPG